MAEQCSLLPSLNFTEFSSKKETKLSQVAELSLVSIGESVTFFGSGHSKRDLPTNRNRLQIFAFENKFMPENDDSYLTIQHLLILCVAQQASPKKRETEHPWMNCHPYPGTPQHNMLL